MGSATRLRTWGWRLTFGVAVAINLAVGIAGVWALTDEFLVLKYGTGTYWVYTVVGAITLVAMADRLRRPAGSQPTAPEAIVICCAACFLLLFVFAAFLVVGGA